MLFDSKPLIQKRRSLGMSVSDLASMVGLSTCAIKAIESGFTKDPHIKTLYKICMALGVSIYACLVDSSAPQGNGDDAFLLLHMKFLDPQDLKFMRDALDILAIRKRITQPIEETHKDESTRESMPDKQVVINGEDEDFGSVDRGYQQDFWSVSRGDSVAVMP